MEAPTVKIAVVKEDDQVPVTLEVLNEEAGIESIKELVSKSGEISFVDLGNIGLRNVMIIIDGEPINSKGGYNFSLQIYPIFGPAVFLQFGVNAAGEVSIVEMEDEKLQEITEFVQNQRKLEAENGLREAIMADINKYGREGYIKRIDAMFADDSLDREYERAKAEQMKDLKVEDETSQ